VDRYLGWTLHQLSAAQAYPWRMTVSDELLARLWRIGKPFQARFLWLVNAKFACGVTGLVRAEDGRFLLLRHRFWAPGQQWGFPSGLAKRGERHEDTIIREVREETGLTVTVGRLLEVESGSPYHVFVYYEATLTGTLDGAEGLDGLVLDSREILDAGLFTTDTLPPDMPLVHRELALRSA
jgi:8-oxo-dGTP diphosphatase